jgi:hypothetical protein
VIRQLYAPSDLPPGKSPRPGPEAVAGRKMSAPSGNPNPVQTILKGIELNLYLSTSVFLFLFLFLFSFRIERDIWGTLYDLFYDNMPSLMWR